MTIADPPKLMTTDQLLALPENDELTRELVGGELREREATKRNFGHSRIQMNCGYVLRRWIEQQPEPHGTVVGGECAVRIARNPDTSVGVDFAYIGPELTARTDPNARLVDGLPEIIAEILSPSDVHEDIAEKVEAYMKAGVKLVWIIDPRLKIIAVCRPGKPPEGLNVTQSIDCSPDIDGLRVSVAELLA